MVFHVKYPSKQQLKVLPRRMKSKASLKIWKSDYCTAKDKLVDNNKEAERIMSVEWKSKYILGTSMLMFCLQTFIFTTSFFIFMYLLPRSSTVLSL